MIKTLRGMHDMLPPHSTFWRYTLIKIEALIKCYGFLPINLPILENLALFERLIGEQTDIVNKEMYTFDDRSGNQIALRPEGTAGCMRALLQSKKTQGLQKLWYWGPMFRYERPQKGRFRQFHQLGLEIIGNQSPTVDVELLLMLSRVWKVLGLSGLQLELNNIGDQQSRDRYTQELKRYFIPYKEHLSALNQLRLATNPLRLLDSKSDFIREKLKNAPRITQLIDDESKAHFKTLLNTLDSLGIDYVINDYLVRGLDYYNQTVFEWKSNQLGSQTTLCGGGRFNYLSQQLGGNFLPAVGCSIGWERLIFLLKVPTNQFYQTYQHQDICHLYAISLDGKDQKTLFEQLEKIRDQLPKLIIQTDLGGGSVRTKFKRADQSGAKYTLVLAPDEWKNKQFILKDFSCGEQTKVSLTELIKKMS